MNIREALAVSDMTATTKAPLRVFQKPSAKAEHIAERIFALGEERGTPINTTVTSWQRAWLQSKTFYLVDLPLYFAARTNRPHENKVQNYIRAAADSIEPIVVDVNKQKIGQAAGGYYPPVVVIDGNSRHRASELQGHETVRAWVGELAAQALGLFDKKNKPVKQERPSMITTALQAAADRTAQTVIRHIEKTTSSLECSMQIFGVGGGMGAPSGVSSSLGQGSGPGPSMVMKPKPAPGNMTPALKSQTESGGYLGYKRASATQSAKMKGGLKSTMAKRLKGSGYFGYKDATDKQRQRMKAPKKSEMQDPKTRNKTFSSAPDIGDGVDELKGAAVILADAKKVSKIWNDLKLAMSAGWKPRMDAKAPPGWENSVKKMKDHPEITNPYALSWYMKDKGYHPGGSKKKSMAADVVLSHKNVDIGEKMPKRKNPADSLDCGCE